MRVFKNDEAVRYVGSIHERLNLLSENVVWYDGITVFHTGYSESSIKETNKIERNIDLLRKAIAATEDNLALKVYLADSLKTKNDKESQAEAEKYFAEAIEHGADKIFYKLRVKAYIHFLNKFVNDPEKRSECETLCSKALTEFPNSLDFECFMASLLNYKGCYKEAWDMLKVGEEKLTRSGETGIAYHVQADPAMLYTQLLLSAQGLDDTDNIVKYATLILKEDKTRQELLSPLIAKLLEQGASPEELLSLLSGVYTISDPNDLLIIARAAMNCGAVEFARMIQVTQEFSNIPLLADVTALSSVYLRDVIASVIDGNLQEALNQIFLLSESEIPDKHAQSYLFLARNLCAACEYADGWVMFQKEIVRFLAGDGRTDDAAMLLKELEELLPEDNDLAELRSMITKALNRRKSEEAAEMRSKEEVDPGFKAMMDLIAPLSEKQLFEVILQGFDDLTKANRTAIENYFNFFPFWGDLDMENKVYDALRNRARVVHKHYKDFLRLYDCLADARSKNVLFGILANWICLDLEKIESYQDRDLTEYYHPEIFPIRDNEVFVDIGAYNGDSVANFIMAYGLTYKRIYCYEILDEVFHIMEENLKDVPNLELRKKAVGSEPGVLYIDQGAHNSSSQLTNAGESAIEVIRLDDDIDEAVTFIKMDIEGAEQDALRGCERQIRENHPHLAICTYHGYKDIIEIPLYINKIAPGYKFYMRHHGGNCIPTEFSLLAVWGDGGNVV